MITKEEIKKEINDLMDYFNNLFDSVKSDEQKIYKNFKFFVYNYDLWYSKALNIVKNIMPDRENDFVILYRNEKRKKLDNTNYTISDILKGLQSNLGKGNSSILSHLIQQKTILQACLEKFDSKVYDIKETLRADLFDSELDSAKYLLKNGFLRASGAICGVILEKHLSQLCVNHNIAITKKEPTLSTYNDVLKDVIYDTVEWRRMQRLADLRNLCDHDKKREPTKDEVEELISGTDRVIKTIF